MGGGEGRGKRRRREGEETKREGKKGEKENLIFCRELWFPRANFHRKREDVCQIFLGNSK